MVIEFEGIKFVHKEEQMSLTYIDGFYDACGDLYDDFDENGRLNKDAIVIDYLIGYLKEIK